MAAYNLIYSIGANNLVYGYEPGICRISGKEGIGIPFEKWVKDTFNDHDRLFPGDIISNEAAFCFDEQSKIIQLKTRRDKPQRFRTYSHIVYNREWFCLTKADKRQIFNLIISGAEMVCLAETGQKHILFKHKSGFWQLEELHIKPDIETLKHLHYHMCELLSYQFSQNEIVSGSYISARVMKAGLDNCRRHEAEIKNFRGSAIFDFASFMLYTDENKLPTNELIVKQNNQIQKKIW